ncbi:uncharacterized protein [Haliotis cracherodii]|uniref:uncharacterized protein n=1 Tax=Haliotis cracherodii TaxID=6455 RepID=UPI0039E9A4CA
MVSGPQNESIDDLLEQELLLRVSSPFNTTRHSPKVHATNKAPPTGRSVRPMRRTLKEFNFEDDLLIPIGRESLSRERRQVVVDPDEGSGTPANIVMATVTLDLPYDPLADYSALQSAASEALFQKYLQADLAINGILETIMDNGGKVQVTHSVLFTDRDDRVLVAYALKKYVLQEGMLAASGPASAPVTTDPTVFNAAGTEIPNTCVLLQGQPSVFCAQQLGPVPSEWTDSTAVELFPWGFSVCDDKLPKLLPNSFDVVSSLLPIDTGFPLGATTQTTLAVGDNGGVSFGTPYNPNTLTDIVNAISPILCAYCADGDLRNTGSSANVFYQTYPLGKAESIPILERATTEVRTHTANSDYVASWAAVVTWDGLPDFDSTGQTMPNPERNTFQAVLSTDGVESYWQIFYGDMQWVVNERQLSVLGFQPTTGVNPLNAFSRTTGSLASQPTQMDMVLGNTGQNGVWLFKTGMVAETNPSARQCREWYIRNYPLKSTFVQRAAVLPLCPCTLDHMLTMGIYFQITKSSTLYCAELIKDGVNQDSKSCCYNIASRGLGSDQPFSGNYYRYGSFSNYHGHVMEDLLPLQHCCIDSPSLCPLFQELRPTITSCLPQPAQRRIGCFGDPHFTTFDGRDFSFNGLGEYTLFTLDYKPQGFKFVLQCRTEVAVRADASTSKATVFTAFAGKQFGFAPTDGGSFHIEMNSNKTKMVVYINGIDRSTLFYGDAHYVEWTSTLYATRISTSTIRFTFPVSEVSIDITLSAKSLSFSVALENKFQGLTSGLLGNFDGDDTNDFNTSSGDSLPATATERQLFDMGKTWAVADSDSILRYSPGMISSDYFNNTFVPLFMDEIDPVTRVAAEGVCGSGASDQCVFDYAVTGDHVLAMSTKTIKIEADETQAVMSNSAPRVNGTDTISVEVGHSVNLEFDGSDAEGDSFKYVLLNQPESGFTFDLDTGRGSWTPTDSTPVKISLNAEDSRGMKSRLINVKVTLCEGCVHGRCDYLSPYTGAQGNTQHFKLAACVCETGWTGSTCSEDYDGCMSGPCGEGRTCTDEAPMVHANTGRGYTCSSCPIGYYSEPGDVKCQDVNECLAGDGCPGNSVCYNTKGSFTCACLSGYRKNSQGKCVDIDECTEHRYNCSQTCVNTGGGYHCDCLSGFALSTDGKTCTQMQGESLSQCRVLALHSAVPIYVLSMKTTAPSVTARLGSNLDLMERHAQLVGYSLFSSLCLLDMNECWMSLCSQTCLNTDGGYTCSCYQGFYLDDDGYSCTECPFPFWGPSCNNTCECKGHATNCDPVHGCVCVEGWTGVNCAVNINECGLDPSICSSQQTCVDTPGSYQCRCPAGFRKQGLECIDINECEAMSSPCQSNFLCLNTAGSFSCHCQEGYTESSVVSYLDIDECTNGLSSCEQLCVNVPGTYNCMCHYGYELSDDRKTCDKSVAASCVVAVGVGCSHYCVTEHNQPRCGCNRGYSLATDRKTCLGNVGCNRGYSLATDGKTCLGNVGCNRGYALAADGKTCLGNVGCNRGYALAADRKTCLADRKTCRGNVGCNRGYALAADGKTCLGNVGCNRGYALAADRKTCLVNVGCNRGYTLAADGKTCLGNIGCNRGYALAADGNTCLADGKTCQGNAGWNRGYALSADGKTCLGNVGCNRGYALSADGKTCLGNVGCNRGYALAADGKTCLGNIGWNRGYALAADGKTCLDINKCTSNTINHVTCNIFPVPVINKCTSNTINHVTCNISPVPDINKCTSNTINHVTCNISPVPDINECISNTINHVTCNISPVPDINECISNTINHVTCNISPVPDINKCTSNTINHVTCNISPVPDINKCTSNTINHVTCNISPVPDINKCTSNTINHVTCNISPVPDINECTSNTINHVTCNISPVPDINECTSNTINHVTCNISPVPDINECTSNSSNQCSHECENIPGAYRCSCPPGMSLQNDERICAACDSQHWGSDCSSMCNCHPQGSHGCDKMTGCMCHSGWTGDKCDQDKNECSTVTCQANSDCQNLPGSYQCRCRSGYSLSADNTTCDEINECSSSKDNMCDHTCHDTEGSYYCSCNPGFVLEGQGTCRGSYYCSCNPGFVLEGKGSCRDIDECRLATSGCSQDCSNTLGGYICECFEGFTLDGSDGKSCIQTTECFNRTSCSQGCRGSGAAEACFCHPGYQLNKDGVTCDDIKECELSPPRCSQGCLESVGSYTCTCDAGFSLAADKTTCEACSYGKYGPNCAQTCSCDASNTISCNATDGSCSCRTGWKGTTCTEDVPECTNTPAICGTNGVCNERNGSYSCTCLPGHVRTNNSCSVCDAKHYGENCARQCTCVFANTESCDSVTGSCTCRPQWRGSSCDEDVDECTDSAPMCTAANQKCRNKLGSFECDCDAGYVKAANNVCVDENECLQRHLHSCEYDCVNLLGTYACVCPRGYSGAGNYCQAAFIRYNTTITFNMDRRIVINGTSSSLLYVSLQDSIATAVDSVVETVAREAFVPSKTGSLRSGSVVADVELRVDTRNTDIPWSILAAILQKLAATPTLPVSGQTVPLQAVAYNGTKIPNSADACDVLKIVQRLSVDADCVIGPGGVPETRDQTDEAGSGVRMLVVVGVTVPTVLVLVVCLTVLLYCCCWRQRKETPAPPDDNQAFRSAFTGNLPTKGNFGASRYMMYSPHTLSEAGSQDSGESSIRHKSWRNVPPRQDVPDSCSREGNAFPSHPITAGQGNERSNFSWENMFNKMDPFGKGQFAVPRPLYQKPPERRLKVVMAVNKITKSDP